MSLGLDVILNLINRTTGGMRDAESNIKSSTDRMKESMKLSFKIAGVGAAAAGVAYGARRMVTSFTGSIEELTRAQGQLQALGVENIGIITQQAMQMQGRYSEISSEAFLQASYAVRSGIETLTDEGVAAMTSSVATVAKATDGQLQQMAGLFASSYNIYKGQFAEISDAAFGDMLGASLAAATQKFLTDGQKMEQAMSAVGASASNLGMDMNEVITILGMLQTEGVAPAESGTALRAFATNAARADAAFKELAEASGGAQVRILNEAGQLRDTADIMADLYARYGEGGLTGAEAEEIKQAFGTDEAMKLINALWDQEHAIRANEEALSSAASQGAEFTESMADAADDTFAGQMGRLNGQLRNLQQTIGLALVPVISDLAGYAERIVQRVTSWAQANPRLFKTLGTVVVVVGGLAAGIAALSFVLAPLVTGITAVRIAMTVLGRAMLMNPIGLIITGIAIAATLIIMYWEPIKAFFLRLWEGVKVVFRATWEWIKNIFFTYTPHGLIITHWDSISAWFSGLWDRIKQGVSIGWELIKSVFFNYTPHGLIISNWDSISEWFSGLWARVQEGTSLGWDLIKTVFFNYTPHGLIITHWEPITQFFAGLWQGISDGIVSAWEGIRTTLTDIGQSVIDAVKGVFSINSPSTVFSEFGQFLMDGLIQGIRNKLAAVQETITNVGSNVVGWFREKLGIQSPSRVFASLGGYLSEGLAVGIGQGEGQVLASMDRIRAGLVRPLTAGLGVAGLSFGGAGLATAGGLESGLTASGTGGGQSIVYSPTYSFSFGAADTGASSDLEETVRRVLDEHKEQALADMRAMLND